jgi:hypothetical protein
MHVSLGPRELAWAGSFKARLQWRVRLVGPAEPRKRLSGVERSIALQVAVVRRVEAACRASELQLGLLGCVAAEQLSKSVCLQMEVLHQALRGSYGEAE